MIKNHKRKDKSRYEIITNRIIGATPLICTFIYLFIGFEYNLWHPCWVIFLAIPIVPSILRFKSLKGMFPIVIAVAYFLLGIFLNKWHPGWIIFLLIPIFYILFPEVECSKKDDDDDDNDDEVVIIKGY
ncbi:MAG: hypothetical protein ACOX02_02135 [Acholeplasmatales bacterium]